jgi:hypothetical protein
VSPLVYSESQSEIVSKPKNEFPGLLSRQCDLAPDRCRRQAAEISLPETLSKIAECAIKVTPEEALKPLPGIAT